MRVPITASVPRFSEAGFLYAQILLLLVIPSALVFMHSWGYDQRSYGLFVHLYADHIPKTGSDSCVQAWTVQVDSDQHWFLNEQEITPSALPRLLSQQFERRSNCTVYFDSDPDVPYAIAIPRQRNDRTDQGESCPADT
jgi:hypothetical protein